MDNKKWHKRFGTIFWWGLTILPLIVVLIQFIGYHLTFNSGITSATELVNYQSDIKGEFIYLLEYNLMDSSFGTFNDFILPFTYSMWYDLFDLLGVGGFDYFTILFAWMTSVQFYHLLFDFIVWLPKFFHNILDKGVGKIDD